MIEFHVVIAVLQEAWLEKSARHCNNDENGLENEKLLLSVVGDLAVLEVEFVHEGLAIKEVIERFISNLKKPRAQTEKTSLQKWRNLTCETPTYSKSDCFE